MKILHVDDQKEWRENVRRALSEKPEIELVSCKSLYEARQAYKNGGFDWVICDDKIVYANDGLDWAKELHAREQKVILLSTVIPSNIKFVGVDKLFYGKEMLIKAMGD